ncbi:hypothetical protein FACS1894139_11880 [Planctomycetales bacterium]|nr:hypothetical protein FACS1894108_04980 [Planctomycetales bacterium]GHT06315.1 hypothetical protein FACS1894139_11880 [Planctomycetales bacterium]
MDKSEVVKSVRRYAAALRAKNIEPEEVVLFGSYATGTAHADSDIDVAVVVRNFDFDRDYQRTVALLWRVAGDTCVEIEPLLIDRNRADRSGFIEHILTTGEVIYDKSLELRV